MKQIKKQSVSNNFIFQFAYQIWMLIIPLIIAPYLTRVLGDTAIGIFTYANSIAYYFIIFANLGISRYGQRIIAQSSNTLELRMTFWSLFVTHIIFSVLSILAYIVFVFCFVTEYQDIYWIETIYVFSAIFDITWLFYGLENFKSVAIRSFLIKGVELMGVFAFVKSPADLPSYALITACAWLAGQIVMIPQAVAIIKPIKFGVTDMRQHIKPLLVFFISTIAITLYTVFDKTLLGIFSTKENVAYYEYANKIISIPRTFMAVIGTVLYPRACKLAREGNREGQVKYLNLSITMVAFIGTASLFGLLAISELFSAVYFGTDFLQSGYIMMGMAVLPLICGLGEIVRAQYMIPNGMDREYIICILFNAITNLVISCALIPFLGAYGAVIGTCTAEMLGCFAQIYLCRNWVKPSVIIKNSSPFFAIGVGMYVVIKTALLFLGNGVLDLIIVFLVGALVFIGLTLVYFRLWNKEYWNAVTNFFKKQRRKVR